MLYDLEASAFSSLADTEDAREGTAAFLGKRSPGFHGR
jgi:enoyl-CoA hydratase/carnithine racemase